MENHHEFWEQFLTLRRSDVHKIFHGEYNDTCSTHDFLTHMPGAGGCSDFTWGRHIQLTVFWDWTKDETESESEVLEPVFPFSVVREYAPAAPRPPRSIKDRIRSFLLWVYFWSDPVLLQFWAPIKTTNGQIMLTLSKEPFGLGHLYIGLCRYRYSCVENEYWREDNNQVGPPGRVYKQGSPEFCPNIECYSTEEFPMRNYALDCGIIGYWALPLLECDGHQQRCVGVLEYLSFKKGINVVNHVDPVVGPLKDVNLACPSSHFHECNKIRKDVLSPLLDIKNVLNFVREAHQVPLIQVWVPCMCDDVDENCSSFVSSENETTKLFCDMRVCDRNLKYFPEFAEFNSKYGTCYVRHGQGLVGRAYSQNKPCFFRDTSQFSLTDYPFVHLTRSSGLAACFAIPLQLVHPTLDALLLEIFLPPEQNCDGNLEAVLTSLLSTVAQGFSKLNIALGLKQGEEFQVEFTHSDDEKFDYFYIHRSIRNLNSDEALESFSSNGSDTNAKNKQSSLPDHRNAQDRSDCSKEVITIVEAQITLDVLKPYFGRILTDAAENLGVSRSTLKRRCRELGIKRWPWHKKNKVDHIQSNPRLPTRSVEGGGEAIQEPETGRCPYNNDAQEKEAATPEPISTSANNKSSIPTGGDDTVIVKATYKDDIVMFPLRSNSGIEELRRELDERFELNVERFKIKYEYEGEWIMIACDKDLWFRMNTLKSSGQTTMNLSVLPAATF